MVRGLKGVTIVKAMRIDPENFELPKEKEILLFK